MSPHNDYQTITITPLQPITFQTSYTSKMDSVIVVCDLTSQCTSTIHINLTWPWEHKLKQTINEQLVKSITLWSVGGWLMVGLSCLTQSGGTPVGNWAIMAQQINLAINSQTQWRALTRQGNACSAGTTIQDIATAMSCSSLEHRKGGVCIKGLAQTDQWWRLT